MTKGLKEGEPNGRDIYPDIIDLPHHQSPTRPHMSLYDRAAQFAPFSALTGYEDMVEEEARLTDSEIGLSDEVMERLSQKLNLIANVIDDGKHPTLTITYFVPDELKTGGKYLTVTEEIKRIEPTQRRIILMKTSGYAGMNVAIDIDRVCAISGELVDYLDDVVE